MKFSLQVLKFGGTSVGNGERIRHVAHIIARTFHEPAEAFPIVVVSALSKVTDQLLDIAELVCAGEQEDWQRKLTALKQRHLDSSKTAVHNDDRREVLREDLRAAFAILDQNIIRLQEFLATDLTSISKATTLLDNPDDNKNVVIPPGEVREEETARSNASYIAAIAAWGERLAVLLLAAAVEDVGVQSVPVREEIIVTGQFTNELSQSPGAALEADPLLAETRRNAQAIIVPLIEQQMVPIIAGFIGRTATGMVTTLGRNGSDYSAAVIGAALDCEELSIYTDVDGVLSADPQLVMNTRLLERLSYAEAARLAWFGAKVLHPRTLIPLAPRNIPVRVRNSFRPEIRGTVVGPVGKQQSGAAAITVRRYLALITVESSELFGAPENAGQVFALAARAGAAPVAICSSAGHHLAFMVEERAATSVVALLQQDMGAWLVHSRSELAACACIGSGFTVDPMSSARAITALARERIPVITQGTSELGITLIVEDGDSERALRCLHRDLIAPVIPLVRHNVHEQRHEAL